MHRSIGLELYQLAQENGYENELLIISILLMVGLIILAEKSKNKEK